MRQHNTVSSGRRWWRQFGSWAALLALLIGCSSNDPKPARDLSADRGWDRSQGPDRAVRDLAPLPDRRGPDQKRLTDRALKPDTPVPASIKVLFLGNSFTFFNQLPQLVQKLSAASGKKPAITVDSVTDGGRRMAEHWTDPQAKAKIKAGGWRFVVLQGQSSEPVVDRSGFLTASKQLAGQVSTYKGIPLFFQTFAYKKGYSFYTQYGGDPKAMQKMIRDAYSGAAQASPGSQIAPAGDAFETYYAKQSTPDLHDGDKLHPSLHGSYLAACVFFAKMTGLSPVGNSFRPAGISASEAKTLQTVAQTTVTRP